MGPNIAAWRVRCFFVKLYKYTEGGAVPLVYLSLSLSLAIKSANPLAVNEKKNARVGAAAAGERPHSAVRPPLRHNSPQQGAAGASSPWPLGRRRPRHRPLARISNWRGAAPGAAPVWFVTCHLVIDHSLFRHSHTR